jgi:hypothetical protein
MARKVAMRSRSGLLTLSLLITVPVFADSIIGVDIILCAPGYVTHCSSGGTCETVPPRNFDIPSFVQIDLGRELLISGASTDDERQTRIQYLSREDGEIYLQGVESGRAYSVVIDEASGDGTLAIAADGETATAFLACKPD